MKLTPYAQILKAGKEKAGELLVPMRVRRARKQAELEMCKLDEKIAVKEAELHEICAEEKVDFPKIIETQDDLALLERRRTQYKKILDEMFPLEDDEE